MVNAWANANVQMEDAMIDELKHCLKICGNKAKGRISKRMFQEIKPRQIFWKKNICYPLTRINFSWGSFLHIYLLQKWHKLEEYVFTNSELFRLFNFQ